MAVTEGAVDAFFAEFHAAEDKPAAPVFSRSTKWHARYTIALIGVDIAAALAACAASFLARGSEIGMQIIGVHLAYRWLAPLSVLVWLLSMSLTGSYRPSYSTDQVAAYRAPILTGFRLMAAAAVASFAFRADLSRLAVLVFFPTLIVTAVAMRWVVRHSLARLRRSGVARIRLLVVGDSASVHNVSTHFCQNGSGYEVVGVCVSDPYGPRRTRSQHYPVLGSPDEVGDVALRSGVHAVAVANSAVFESTSLQSLAWSLERTGIDLLVAPDVADVAGPRIRVAPISGMPLLHITEAPVDTWLRKAFAFGSRLVAIPMAVLLAPIMAVIALAILIDSGGPVFYRQERVGYRRRTFSMIKFRTMVPEADKLLIDLLDQNEADGVIFKLRNDPRVTRVGRILRKYSLDELPQIINVLRGEMVFVGPRPVLPREIAEFGPTEDRRFCTKPGITGLWQVSGRSEMSWREAVKLDLFYVENWSPLLDLSILVRTVSAVFGGTGC